MTKKVRLNIPGYWYHVYSRGQRKQPLFFSPDDRFKYLSLLNKYLLRYGGYLGAFCLMVNHLHLLIKMEIEPLGNIFRTVNSKFAEYFNNKRNTVGHVFQGRPGIKIILDEKYLNNVVKYILNNPVEAAIVNNIYDYKWSSVHVKDNKFYDLILDCWQPPEIQSFGNNIETYKIDFEKNDYYIGDKEKYLELEKRNKDKTYTFISDNRKKLSLEDIIKTQLKYTEYTEEQIFSSWKNKEISNIRKNIIILMFKFGYKTCEIAGFLHKSPAFISKIIKNYMQEN